MAEALARGFIEKGVITADRVHATDIAKTRRDLFQSFGAHAYEKNVQVSFPAIYVLELLKGAERF